MKKNIRKMFSIPPETDAFDYLREAIEVYELTRKCIVDTRF